MELLNTGILGFVVIAALAIFGVVIVAVLLARIVDRFAEKRSLSEDGAPVIDVITPAENVELLPAQLQNVNPDIEPFVRAIYFSVKRYKDLFQFCRKKSYHCTARSKRYVLRISLSPETSRKYFLNVVFEGEHPHHFSLDYPDWLATKFSNKKNRLYFSPGLQQDNDSKITEAEIATFLEPMSFFTSVNATPGILNATRTLESDTSMENWPQVLSAFVRLGRYLMDSIERKEILEIADVLCPYCRAEFSGKDDTVSCRECKTRHHQECWEEVGRCSVFGCRSKSEIIVSQN